MIKKVFLDVQHAGKPNKPFDRGASNNGYHESDICLQHAIAIRKLLHEIEIPTYILTFGSYSERHNLVNLHSDTHETLYIALHLNSSEYKSAGYTLFEYARGSMNQTIEIAKLLAKHAHKNLGIKLPDRTFAPDGIKELKSGERGYSCIYGVGCSGVLSEALFVSNYDHLDIALHKQLEIAQVYSKAIQEFNKT